MSSRDSKGAERRNSGFCGICSACEVHAGHKIASATGEKTPRRRKRKTALDSAVFLVERGGFEPPKSLTTDLQSAPFGHSGTSPSWSW